MLGAGEVRVFFWNVEDDEFSRWRLPSYIEWIRCISYRIQVFVILSPFWIQCLPSLSVPSSFNANTASLTALFSNSSPFTTILRIWVRILLELGPWHCRQYWNQKKGIYSVCDFLCSLARKAIGSNSLAVESKSSPVTRAMISLEIKLYPSL